MDTVGIETEIEIGTGRKGDTRRLPLQIALLCLDLSCCVLSRRAFALPMDGRMVIQAENK